MTVLLEEFGKYKLLNMTAIFLFNGCNPTQSRKVFTTTTSSSWTSFML